VEERAAPLLAAANSCCGNGMAMTLNRVPMCMALRGIAGVTGAIVFRTTCHLAIE